MSVCDLAGAENSRLRTSLSAQLGSAVMFNEPLWLHTSFKVGGPADIFVLAADADDLARTLSLLRAQGIPVVILGGGTNLLVSDKGIRGGLIKLGAGFTGVEWGKPGAERVELRAGAAARLSLLAAQAARRSFSGLEFAEGIPGTVGGALIMNAGAFGGDMASVTEAVEGVSLDGEKLLLSGDELSFRYRRLELSDKFVITAGRFRLRTGTASEVRRAVTDNRARRKTTQPLIQPNAGSVFKNPPGDSAGRLIEAAGLKGTRLGKAEVSPAHGNFIVNLGGATASDIAALIEKVQLQVCARFGVKLELELQMVGEW